MRRHSSLPSFGENSADWRALVRRVGSPVVVGSAAALVAAAFVGLAVANSRSSSSCETDSVTCDTADVITATAETQTAIASDTTSATSEPDHATQDHVVMVPAAPSSTDPSSTDPASTTSAPGNVDSTTANPDPTPATPASANPDPTPATPAPANPDPAPTNPAPSEPDPTPAPANPAPAKPEPAPTNPSPVEPAPVEPNPVAASYNDITTFGVFHGTSSHTHGDSLAGGRTAITTEAFVVYNGLRGFLGLGAVELETIGQWAFANSLTNNDEAYGQELKGVGLYYGMQGAKVGWIRDDAFDPQILVDIQRTAREGGTSSVMTMVETFGHPGYADHLTRSGLVDAFVNTMKMEPHYGGWMHGRVHGGRPFSDGTGASVATAHDVNHLTVLSHDQTQPFMNDTFDWPQWPALDVSERDVINYFQSMVVLGDPNGDALP